MNTHKYKLSSKFIIVAIFFLAAVLRLYNINWDQGFHLHPDERFLTLVGTAMKLPTSFSQYLDPKTSLFNPANINYKFYVYGMFPVTLNKLIAVAFHTDNYNDFTIIGRMISAIIDLLIMVVIFKITTLFKKHHEFPEAVIPLSLFFYAITVFAIQQSHFFTVDTFLSFFVMASLYCSLKFYYEKNFISIFLSGLFFALGVASKVSAVYVLPLLLFFLLLGLLTKTSGKKEILLKKITSIITSKKFLLHLGLLILLFFATAYFALRLADPYYFKDQNILNPQLNPGFLENLHELEALSTPTAMFPPAVQWVHKIPVLFSLSNMALWGVGSIYFLFSITGIYFLFKKHKHFELLAILVWAILFFLYQSTRFATTMRYFFFLYPFLAIYAALGFHYLIHSSLFSVHGKAASSVNREPITVNHIIQAILIVILLIYPLSFMSIYLHPVTRVSASKWIYQHILPESFLLNEHWDDALPLPLIAQQYPNDLLPVFDPDSPEKWKKMNMLLQKGNYLILSSNRGWGSIPTVPERYPQMTKFYQDLFAGKLQYKKVAEFTSYPSLKYLGIPISFPDDSAEEAFTVYDHPKVMIFRKM